jgi:hypothetical protein
MLFFIYKYVNCNIIEMIIKNMHIILCIFWYSQSKIILLIISRLYHDTHMKAVVLWIMKCHVVYSSHFLYIVQSCLCRFLSLIIVECEEFYMNCLKICSQIVCVYTYQGIHGVQLYSNPFFNTGLHSWIILAYQNHVVLDLRFSQQELWWVLPSGM